MTDPYEIPGHTNPVTPDGTTTAAPGRARRSLSMHDGIAVWCDCCSCEAEPYWVEIAAGMGMTLGSDYEEDGDPSADPDRPAA